MTDDRRRSWARKSAVHYLSGRASSAENLRRIMFRRAARRWPDAPTETHAMLADEAVSFCMEHRFVDDSAYAVSKVSSAVVKGQSRRKIASLLARKGISTEHSMEAMESADDLQAAARFARRRRFGPWRTVEGDRERKLRETAAMGRAGFPSSIAFRIVSMDLDEAEEAIHGRHESG